MLDKWAKLRAIAQETCAIIQNKGYDHPQVGRIDLSPSLDHTWENSLLYTPRHISRLRADRDRLLLSRQDRDPPSIIVRNQGTFEAAKSLISEEDPRCVVLNFASATRPGGGFLDGAMAQEEYLCRASTLYYSLSNITAFYTENIAERSSLYTDHAIHSPEISVIRDEYGFLLAEPYIVDVITSPAPNASAISEKSKERKLIASTLIRRMEQILSIAVTTYHRKIVLGAWGCGAFGNDPYFVAAGFKTLLSSKTFKGAFDKIIFAILDKTPDRKIITPFEKAFGA